MQDQFSFQMEDLKDNASGPEEEINERSEGDDGTHSSSPIHKPNKADKARLDIT